MKPIFDACCGGKMFYFDKQDPRVLFMDIRQIKTKLCDGRDFEVSPDIVGDFAEIPLEDNIFNMVVFDPPHLLRNTGKSKFADLYGSLNEKARPTGYQQIKYGALYSDWQDMLKQGFAECFRVLKPSGFLIFKWNETDIKVSEVLALTEEKPVFGHKSGKQSKTHWICFMKGGKDE
ncbi:MAG: methyltransferase [Oscillospiraceae bacterium]